MDVECKHCHALRFKDESDSMCCANGKIKLPCLSEPEEPLFTYLSGLTNHSKHFLDNIRKYNSCFNMTSFGANRKKESENMPTDECKIVLRADKIPSNEHERRFNLPVVQEVAAIINGNEFIKRDIILQKRSKEFVIVQETHKSHDALQYPLIFWQGEDGYHSELKQINSNTGLTTNKKVSAMDFYAQKLMIRNNPKNYLLCYKQLLNQFVVDMYAKIESERLRYIRCNQKTLKVYIHLKDAFENDKNVMGPGI
ncbi:uncharacterized protein LOC122859899 [Aphidius gifuensis]|uniref:uncharacterized protein LOC122859899 n=1 Tax=Aphidius gifuensis TaxID=684658 RepID=UPI001CDCABEF|nr:uncharacterized protein LOC122859899 [Aphidius gifuensis]